MITFYNVRKTNNTGDLACNPLPYFRDLFPKAKPGDIRDNGGPAMAIYGGGALGHALDGYAFHHGASVNVAWGVGCTTREQTEFADLHQPSRFSIYGRRDTGSKAGTWTPCPSCMAPEFDTKRPKVSECAVYDHRTFPVPLFECPPDAPHMHNQQGADLASVLDFLGGAETVYTSSWHGAQWAKWLGCKVKVFPFGSKFAAIPDSSLLIARQETRFFAQRVADLARSLQLL